MKIKSMKLKNNVKKLLNSFPMKIKKNKNV